MRVSRRVLFIAGGVAVILLAGVGGAYVAINRRVSQIQRMPDPFAGVAPEERPPAPAHPAMTVLLAGVDSGSRESATGSDSAGMTRGRTDALLLARLSDDHVYLVSLPRDGWVNVPGHGEQKLNSAFAVGGPPLMVRTVESLTGIRIDHVAVIDLAGFRELTDAVGGVTITVPADTYDPSQQVEFKAGTHRFDGATALQYVRQRHGLPRGDLDRVRRHQQFVLALADEIGSGSTLSNPFRALAVFDAIAKTTTVDAGLSVAKMTDLMMDFHRLRANLKIMTVPVTGTGMVGDQSVVFLDPVQGPEFWQAIASDRIEDYLSGQRAETLDGPPN